MPNDASIGIVSRAAAIKAGLTRYRTGKPCLRGHFSERTVSSRSCTECSNEKQSLRYNADKGASRQYHREWYSAKQESILKKKSEWREANREKVRRASREWYARNAEIVLARNKSEPARLKAREYQRKWLSENRHLARARYAARRARVKGATGRFYASDIQRIFEDQSGMCRGCGADIAVLGYEADHVMPLALGGTNHPENIQLLCVTCNRSKGAKHPNDWSCAGAKND